MPLSGRPSGPWQKYCWILAKASLLKQDIMVLVVRFFHWAYRDSFMGDMPFEDDALFAVKLFLEVKSIAFAGLPGAGSRGARA